MSNYLIFEGIIQFVKENRLDGNLMCQDPLIRHRLAQMKIEFEVGRLFMYRVALVIDEGRAPEWEAALSKAYATAFEQRLADIAMEILGAHGQLKPNSKGAKLGGMSYHSYLSSKGYSLQGGTSEVLKNILAVRKLGLPAG